MNGLATLAGAGLALLFGIGGGGGGAKNLQDDAVSLFQGPSLQDYSLDVCTPKGLKRDPQYGILCDISWHPMSTPGTTEKPTLAYRLFVGKSNSPPTIIRISSYSDGSGSLWLTTFEKDEFTRKPKAKARVADLSPADLSSLFPKIEDSDFWKVNASIPGVKIDPKVQDYADCSGALTYVLEGQRADTHRALAARSCTKSKWILNISSDIVGLTRAKIPDAP